MALILLGGGLASPLQASDSTARAMMEQAYVLTTQNNVADMQQAFIMYGKSLNEADSPALRKQITRKLENLDRRYSRLIQSNLPDFLDRPYETDREFYQSYAEYGSTRGMRLYGEFLLKEGNCAEGMSYIRNAAEKGDGRASFILAESYGYGRNGLKTDRAMAVRHLRNAAERNYGPAYELLAEISWDGTWGVSCNGTEAISYVDKAIACYEEAMDSTNCASSGLAAYVDELKALRGGLVAANGADFSNMADELPLLGEVRMSYNGVRLNLCSARSAEGVRRRLGVIHNEMENYRGTYKLGKLGNLDLSYFEIEYEEENVRPGCLGVTCPSATDSTIDASITIFPHASNCRGFSSSENGRTSAAFWESIQLDDTLAHELSHVYFLSRYPHIGANREEHVAICEGHATNAAYEFINFAYFNGTLSPEAYAKNFLSPDYRGYFLAFRRDYMDESGRILWDKLDREDMRAANDPEYMTHTRRQDTNKNRFGNAPQYDGWAFHGGF